MSINTALGIISTLAFLLPPIIILYSRLFINISLLALVFYFLLLVIYNLMSENILFVSPEVKRKAGVIANYSDVPLILMSMLLFCIEKWKQKLIMTLLILFMVYEAIILFKFQLTALSSKYVMGPGIILIFILSVYFFIINIRHTIVQGKGIGKTLMASSILFAYGCYLLVYIFAYIVKTSNRADVFTIYYLASIIFSLLMSAGLIWVKKRFKEIEEAKTTRRELHMFFNN